MGNAETYTSKEEYLASLKARSAPPAGFSIATSSLSFFPPEIGGKKRYTMNLSLILLDRPTDAFHAVYTKNVFCGAPVEIGRERLRGNQCRGILINNKISNVFAHRGVEDADRILRCLGDELQAESALFFPASTGIIGWKLPVPEICAAIPSLVRCLQRDSVLPAAQSIMTTDTFAKVRSAPCGEGRIVALAKGAGMIEPNMATMLVFICTDCDLPRSFLAESLSHAADESFNTISVDGDQSTSDMAMIVSSRCKPCNDREEFKRVLTGVCRDLCDDIVRNGEGVSHVIQVTVSNAGSPETASGAGKAIINSPLVKTAVFGNDPNVGRIIGALGDYFGSTGKNPSRPDLTVSIGGISIFSDNSFRLDGEKEETLRCYLAEAAYSTAGGFPPHYRTVDILVELKQGRYAKTVIGADLTYEYVRENAAYRS